MSKLRPIWHPIVHEHYREQLRFLGLEVTNYGRALEYLRKRLNERVSIYEVFGDRDIIARLFVPESEYIRLCDLLRQNVGTITADFFVDEILYMWGFPVPWLTTDTEACIRGRNALAEFDTPDLENASVNWEEYPEKRKERLKESGLVIGEASDPSGREAIRAFVLVGSGFTKKDWLAEIANRLQNRVSAIQQYLHGLYFGRGTGFEGNILIELDIPNEKFEEIIEIIRETHDVLHFIEPKTKTYVAGDVTREHIDQCYFAPTLEREVERAEMRFPALASLSFDDQISIMELSRRWSRWLTLPLTEAHAHALIDATIDQRRNHSHEKKKQAITALGNSVEDCIREHFTELAKSKWGAKEWQKHVKTDLVMEKPIKGWTLGETIEAFSRWNARLDEEAISSSCLNTLFDFADLRNAAVHRVRKKDRRIFDDYAEAAIHAIVEAIFALLAELRRS